MVGSHVRPHDLNIERSGQTEVQNLGDHIDGQSVKLGAGKLLRKVGKQSCYILIRRIVIRSQRNSDIRVRRTNGSRRAVRQIQTAVGQTDVVDDACYFLLRDLSSYFVIDQVAEPCRFLNPCASMSTNMNQKLAAVYAGKEVLSKPRK